MTSRAATRQRAEELTLPVLFGFLTFFVCLCLTPMVQAAEAPINIGTVDDPYYVRDSAALQELLDLAPPTASMSSSSAATVVRVGSWTTGLTHTAGAGSNRLLIFSVGYEHSSDPGVSAVTYGGQPLTRIDGGVVGSSTRDRAELWYLNEAGIAAASGNTFSVTWGGSTPSERKYGAATYANVRQIGPIGDSDVQTDGNGSPSTITATVNVVTGGMVVSDVINGNTGGFTWNNSYVEGYDQGTGTSTLSAADRQEFADGTSTASATHNNAGRRVIVAAALVPADATQSLDSLNISQLDPSQFPNICVYVEALDNSGNPYPGLTADSFCVFQDSIGIGSFTVEELTIDSCRTATCLVIDVSGSMGGANMTAAKAAASEFVRNMDVFDRAAVVSFSDCYTVVQNFTGDTTLLLNAINGLVAGGRTAYLDGVYRGVELTVPELGSKAVINLTDGLENNSGSCAGGPDGLGDGFADDSALIVNMALGAGIPIYSITLGSGFDPQYAQKLAYATGGAYYHAPLPSQLDAIYAEIKERLCTRYKICYTSPDTLQNGDCHDVIICYEESPGVCVECDTANYCEQFPPVITRTPATIALDNTCQRWDDAVQLCAYVTDGDTPLSSLTVTLFYRNNNVSPYTSVATTRTDSTFCAYVPASALTCGGDSIQYYFTASDGSVTVASPANAPVGHHAFPICPNVPPVCNVPNDTTIGQCSIVQVCLPVSGTDVNGNLQSCTKISGPGTLSGGQWCYTPAGSETVNVTVRCTDSCGLYCEETFSVTFQANTAPVCSVPNDTSIFQCTAAQVCLPVAGLDGDGNLTGCTIMSGPGTLSGGNWCYTPAGDEVATVTVRCTDACGAYCEETFSVTFTINDPPVISLGPDISQPYNANGDTLCFNYSVSDPQGYAGLLEAVVSAPGGSVVDTSANTLCLENPVPGNYQFIMSVTDPCGAVDYDTAWIFIASTAPPTCNMPADTSILQCAPAQICLPVSATSLYPPVNCVVTSGPGSISGGSWCYTPVGDASFTVHVTCTDSLGATCSDSFSVSIDINDAPICASITDTTIFQCAPTQVCRPVSATDANGNLTGCAVVNGPGTVSGGNWCYTPAGDETVNVTIRCTDACGAYCEETFSVTFQINESPVCASIADTTIFQCAPAQVCRPVSATDGDGNLTGCAVVSGPGTVSGGNWCYTPVGDETVNVTIRCTDACGAYCEETFSVTFQINESPVCASIADTTIFQCTPTQVCRPVSATDGDGNLTGCAVVNGPGTVSGGNWCYTPAGDETVNVTIRCTDACGAYCEETFSVTFQINESPVCASIADTTIFQCTPTQACRPVSATDGDGNLTGCAVVAGPGTVSGGNWCYTPVGDETVNVTIRCTDACGAYCEETFSVTFQINESPVCASIADTTYFQCAPTQVCRPVSATDGDGNLTGCAVVSGPGTVSGGNWCYTPVGDETVNVTIRCTDACGAYCEETFSVTFQINESPVCASIADTTIFLCTAGQVCLPVSATDGDGNLVDCVVVSGPGVVSGGNWCYTPITSPEGAIVTIRCTDACGVYCEESFSVTFYLGPQADIDCPGNLTVACASDVPACNPADATVLAAAGSPGSWTITCSSTDNGGSGCVGDPLIYTYTYELTDSCGSTDQCQRTITVIDDVPPVLSGCPSNVTIECGDAIPPPANVTATDNCDGSVGATLTETPNLNGCGGNTGTITRRWIAVDACGNADTCFQVITVQDTQDPVCNIPVGPFTFFQCFPTLVSFPVSATDDCDASVTCQVISGGGAIVGGQWEYMPSGAESLQVVIQCTDDCGNTCQEVVEVIIEANSAPTIAFGPDQPVFQCALSPICVTYTVDDFDGLAGAVETLVSGPAGASINTGANQVCFTPVAPGTHQIIVQITDTCGAADRDTINVNVTLNGAPTLAFGNDFNVLQCSPAQICVPYAVADPNSLNGAVESLVSAPAGAAINQAADLVCFTPVTSGVYSIIAKITDSCGAADQDTILVTVNMNQPPVCQVPDDTSFFQCSPAQVCLPVSGSDPDGGSVSVTKVNGPGTLSAGMWCYTPNASQTVNVTIRVTDSCGAFTDCTFSATFDLNEPPVCSVPANITINQACDPQEVQLPVSAIDPDGNLDACAIVNGPGELVNGLWVYTPSGTGQVCVTVACTDDCGASCQKTFCIYFNIQDENCDCELIVSVGDNDGYIQAINGQQVSIPVNFDSLYSPIGGFDLLLCYDNSGLSFVSVQKGALLDTTGWEYFTYRTSIFGNCGVACPTGYVRLVGIANLDNGITPSSETFLPLGTIAELTFQVTQDRNFINQCLPIGFCWYDCGDNTIASKSGDTTWVEHTMFIDTCLSNPKVNPIPAICFSPGYICIIEPPDDRGDINMNGIANEVGDAVLFSNYFIYGPSVWEDPPTDQSQILATDINDDGVVLTVADLVYLIRVITGDASPFPPGTDTGHPKVAPYAEQAEVSLRIENGRAVLATDAPVELGAVWAVLRYSDMTMSAPSILNAAEGMVLTHKSASGELRILMRPEFEGERATVASGINDVIEIPFDGNGTIELTDVQLSDAEGAMVTATLAKGGLVPTQFSLLQNYPNPFNAGTVISFTLAEETDWTLTIYNVAGQTVRTLRGHDPASVVNIRWDGTTEAGTSVASGVYLYRVNAGSFTAAKKMILMK